MMAGGAALHRDDQPLKSNSGQPVLRLADINGEPYFWAKAGEVESSHYTDSYAATVPTLFDSTATSGPLSGVLRYGL